MSLAIHADDHGAFRLHRGAEHVGWVEGRAVALLGFASASEARRAAAVAYDALRVWIARQRRTDIPPKRIRALRAERQGARTMLLLDGISIGRLVTPEDSAVPGSTWGFALLLPPGFGPVAGISAAQVIDTALKRRPVARRRRRQTIGA